MENILRNTVFFLCTFLSCASFAEVEETFTYGTQTSTEPLSFDAWNHMVYGVFPGGAASQVAGSEYSNYRADFEKRKYCKANNYPKNVSFCAGFKQQAIESCQQGVTEWFRLAVSDAQERTRLSNIDCNRTYASEGLSASRAACNEQVANYHAGTISGIKDNRDLRFENCSRSP